VTTNAHGWIRGALQVAGRLARFSHTAIPRTARRMRRDHGRLRGASCNRRISRPEYHLRQRTQVLDGTAVRARASHAKKTNPKRRRAPRSSAADTEVDPWAPSPSRTPSWSITPPGTRVPPPSVIVPEPRAPKPIARTIASAVNPDPVSRPHHSIGDLIKIAWLGDAYTGVGGCKGVSGRAHEARPIPIAASRPTIAPAANLDLSM
jgi:hypothetical protein